MKTHLNTRTTLLQVTQNENVFVRQQILKLSKTLLYTYLTSTYCLNTEI